MFSLLAQLTDTSTEATDAAAAAAGATILGGMLIFWIIAGLIGLLFFIWWIILVIDLSKRDFPEKTTWLIVMILGLLLGFLWLADLLYYFMVVKKYGKVGSAPAAPKTQ
ncbi:MAG TPA: hypothetical protein VJJ80_01555 [Patescibacteria group bacterium]|nr:hypothetical protein [Patescibacteria group bacterium]